MILKYFSFFNSINKYMHKRTFINLFIIIFILFIVCDTVFPAEIEYIFDFEYDSNVFSLDKILNNEFLNPDIVESESIVLNGEYKIDISLENLGQLQLGYFKKYQHSLGISEGIIHFLYDINKSGLYQPEYPFKLENGSQLVDGIYIGKKVYSNEDYGVSVEFFGKIIRGLNLERSYYNGKLYIENNQLHLKGVRSSFYSSLSDETELYDVNFSSEGYSFDCNIFWQIDEAQLLSLTMEDLFSKIYWEDIYTTIGEYNTGDVVWEGDYLRNLPGYRGKFYYTDYQTSLIPDTNLSYQNNKIELGLNYKTQVIPYVLVRALDKNILNKPLSISVGCFDKKFITTVSYPYLDLTLAMDGFNASSINNIMGKVALNYSF